MAEGGGASTNTTRQMGKFEDCGDLDKEVEGCFLGFF